MNLSTKNNIIAVLAILLISISAFARKPKWVKERPILTDYYQGIGIATKAGNAVDYVTTARSKALKEMSSEIKVTVSANSLLHQFENNNSVRETYESNTNVNTAQTLEGYEIETYEDRDFYYTYTKLSKSRYEEEKRFKLEKAKKLASINYLKGVELLKNNDVAGALTNFLKVITNLKDHLDEDLTIKSFDGEINLGSDTYTNIQALLQRISFAPLQQTILMKFSREMEQPLTLHASFNSAVNGPIEAFNLPISFAFTKGDGVISPSATTNYEGEATCSLSRLTSHIKRQQIRAQLNINALLDPDEAIAKIQKAFLPIETLPETTFTIEMKRSKAFIEIDETRFTETTNGSYLANNIRAELNQNFFTFTDNLNEADFKIKIKVAFIEGGTKPNSSYTVYIVYGNVNLSITATKTNEEIFSNGVSDIKGMRAGSYDQAVKDAIQKCSDNFEKQIIPQLEQLEM